MAVSCFSAGFPHHSQRLPRGAESTEIGRRNSLVDIRALLVRAGKVDHFLTNKTKGSTTQRGNAYLVLSNVRESTAIRHYLQLKHASSPRSLSAPVSGNMRKKLSFVADVDTI